MDNNVQRMLVGYTRKNCLAVYEALEAVKALEEYNAQFSALSGQSLAESDEVVYEGENSVTAPITGRQLNEAYEALMTVAVSAQAVITALTSDKEDAIRFMNLRG